MAKRTDKAPAPGDDAQPESFQIPEVHSNQASPWDETAASVPRIPGGGELTAGLPGKPKEKPLLSTGMDDYDPDALQRTRANQHDPVVTMHRPARGRMSVLGTELVGDCAIKNELGNREPTRALVTRSRDRKWFFIMPSHHKANKAVEITYQNKQACLNLFGPFQDMGRMVEKGYKEHYYLEMTDEPMMIHGVTGYALYFSLAEYGKEPISQRDESDDEPTAPKKVSRAAKAGSKAETAGKVGGSPQKESSGQPASADTGAPPQAASAPEAEEDDFVMLVKELNEAIDSRDAEIDEIKAKLKAYQEQFGKL
jgi:hypothetical protein